MNPPVLTPQPGSGGDNPRDVRILSVQDVRAVAKLARLALSDDQVNQYQSQLGSVLSYMARLREVDLEGVEPMSHPLAASGQRNRLDEDRPGPQATLATEAFMRLAPETMGPFVKVPKVIGEGGGA